MSLTLRAAISASQTTFDILGTDDLQPGDFKTIGSETVVIRTANQGQTSLGESAYWRVSADRGTGGTRKATHAANAAVATYSAGGGGGSVSVTDGTTTVAAATGFVFPHITDGGGGSVVIASIIVSEDDPGAIGANQLWLQLDPTDNAGNLQLWARRVGDDGWDRVGAADQVGSGVSTGLLAVNADFSEYGGLTAGASDTPGDNTFLDLVVGGAAGQTNLRIFADGIRIGQQLTDPSLLAGTADPSAGGGKAHGSAGLYIRDAGSGVAELWLTTGTGATDWVKVSPA